MSRRGIVWRALTLAVLALLLLASGSAVISSFPPRQGWWVVGGGVLVGLAVAAGSRATGLGWFASAAALSVVHLLVGGVFTFPETLLGGLLPGAETVRLQAVHTVLGWKGLLTAHTPVDGVSGPAVAPFLAAAVCAWAAGMWGLRAQRWWWAHLGVWSLALVSGLWGTREHPWAFPAGAVLLMGSIGWTMWRSSLDADPWWRRIDVRRLSAAAVALAAAVTVGMGAGWAAGEHHRLVLRDHVEPPVEASTVASPLAHYRHWNADLGDEPLVEVSGLSPRMRVRLAAMDSYDGHVFTPAPGTPAVRLGRQRGSSSDGSVRSSLQVTVRALDGPWLPGGGDVRALIFDSGGERHQRRYLNENLGTLMSASDVRPGDSYTVRLADSPASAKATGPRPMRVPEVVSERAAEYIGSAADPVDRLRRIEQRLHTEGYYSNGADERARPGHHAGRIAELLEAPAMVGDDEQYAAAMALMAQELRIPARVVMGFVAADSPRQAFTGKDLRVWVETTDAEGHVVEFDPTPPRDRTPKQQKKAPEPTPQPRVQPPPDPPREPATLMAEVEGSAPDRGLDTGGRGGPLVPGWVWSAAATILAMLAPVTAVVAAKGWRRRKRRRSSPAASVAGAWQELEDAATDWGVRSPRGESVTRSEVARGLSSRYRDACLSAFASRVDAAQFGPEQLSERDVAEVWRHSEETIVAMSSHHGRAARIAGTLSFRSLIGRGSRKVRR